MYKVKARWEELGISNDFIFGKIMRDPVLCKELLQAIFPDMEIDRIDGAVKVFLNAQGTIGERLWSRCHRRFWWSYC